MKLNELERLLWLDKGDSMLDYVIGLAGEQTINVKAREMVLGGAFIRQCVASEPEDEEYVLSIREACTIDERFVCTCGFIAPFTDGNRYFEG